MKARSAGNQYMKVLGPRMKTTTASTKRAWGFGSVVCFVALSACDQASLNNVGDTPRDATAGSDSEAGSASHAGSSSMAGFGGRRNGGGTGGLGDSGASGGFGGGFGGGGSGGTGGVDGFGGTVDGAGPIAGTGGGNFGGSSFGGSSFGGSSFGGSGFGGSGFGGSSFGGSSFGGSSFGGSSFGGSGFGGAGGTPSGSPGDGGSSGNFPGCFAQYEVYAAEDQPDLGPQNTVLLDAHIAQGEVRNSANQLVFTSGGISGGVWETYANFPATTPENAAKTDISLPAELATVPDNLGQLYVTRRSCAGKLVAGRTLKVEVWWKSSATFATMPTHGVALGIVGVNDATTWLGDATKAFVVGDAAANANIDTLNRIALQHTFAVDDTTDARKIVLGLWLLDSQIFPTNFYIGNVQWE